MKREYKEAEIEVISLVAQDIITQSGGDPNEGEVD